MQGDVFKIITDGCKRDDKNQVLSSRGEIIFGSIHTHTNSWNQAFRSFNPTIYIKRCFKISNTFGVVGKTYKYKLYELLYVYFLYLCFKNLVNLLKNSSVDGLEINLKQIDSKDDISDFVSTIKEKLAANLYLAISVPSKPDVLAKYYDFKDLQKIADLFILQTNFLGASTNVTFHPSRLSGLWDMQNTVGSLKLIRLFL